MSRRQTLGTLSPNNLNNRQSLAPGKAGKDSRQSLKPLSAAAGRPSVAPRQLERPSNAGLDPRRSSAFGKSGTAKADPRPLNDKNFFNSCIRTIITYASMHAYPYPLSPKILTSPTGKDFMQLAFWLFQRFDPTLKTFGKVEDEVPLFFKRLNYPFQISKSALFAVGSPHSWPSVLAALSWLVELLNYDDRAEDAAAQQFDEKQRSERQFFAYASTAYRSVRARCGLGLTVDLGSIQGGGPLQCILLCLRCRTRADHVLSSLSISSTEVLALHCTLHLSHLCALIWLSVTYMQVLPGWR